MMSNSSDSEEFYDAEDNTPNHSSRKSRKSSSDSLTQRSNSEPNIPLASKTIQEDEVKQESKSQTGVPNEKSKFVEPQRVTGGRKKFKELRQKLQNDDDDSQPGNISPSNSQTSSVDGVFAAVNKTSHPFRIIEQDAMSIQSMSSLSKLSRTAGSLSEAGNSTEGSRKALSVSVLSFSSHDSESTPGSKDYPSSLTLSTTSQTEIKNDKVCLPLQEPDVIASTKSSYPSKNVDPSEVTTPSATSDQPPVAPPRRKKKKNADLLLTKSASSSNFEGSTRTASSSTAIECLTKELNNLERTSALPSKLESDGLTAVSKSSSLQSTRSLDIKQVTKGQFVVKPQDNESSKASNSLKVDSKERGLPNTDKIKANNSPRGSSTRSSVGHYSLGPHRGTNQQTKRSLKERRKSAGDENLLKLANMKVRTHTDSGKQLSDLEILEQVTVLNLDTGEQIPLSVAEDKLPQCINPLSLHIMRLTSEYVSSSSMEKGKESDDESDKKSEIPVVDENDLEQGIVKKKTAQLKRFLGSTVKKTMHKAKTIAQEVSHARHKEDTIDIVDLVHSGEQNIKLKASNSHKGPYDFEKVEHVQELNNEHEGPIWCMKFSCCGRLLATAGQDKVLRIWIVKDAFSFFQDMRTKYNAEKVSPTPSQESLVSHHSFDISSLAFLEAMSMEENTKTVFMPKPFCTYTGHTSDLLDVSWSKNYFILSSSMDKTVRLWHISRKECLCCFQHIDFVTAIVFHPRDDRYFLSGSLDGKLRLWNIPDKKVAVWNEIETNPKLITAANFCQNGKFAVVGTYDGRCIFYNTDQLKYHTQIHVKSSRGRNSTGRKISGIEPMPGEDKILVTSNDSRIRLYDLRDLNVSCKYKGYVNMSSQIKASFSHDGKFIISGSENRDIYIWKTNHDYSKFSSVRRDRNDFWEAIKAHNAVVTCAIFAPNPEAIIKMIDEFTKTDEKKNEEQNKVEDPVVEQHTKGGNGYVLISADFNGCIKVFVNKMKPKHSSLPVSAMA